jgi:hypothetical protein
VDFSEARGLFGIIFQIPGSDCKVMDRGLILKKPRGLSAKYPKLDFLGPRWPGPPWTGGHCRARELIRAQPSAAPMPESSDRRAGERNGGWASPMVGLPWLGRRWKGVSPAAEASAQKGDDEGAVRECWRCGRLHRGRGRLL